MLDKLINLFSKPSAPVPEPAPVATEKVKKPRKPRAPKPIAPEPSDKEKATIAGEPWVGITKVDVDPTNINSGSFTLDWNDKFLLNLVKTGYRQKEEDSDAVIVDRWFQTVCRNVALEMYEQQQADPENRDLRMVRSRDLGNGRTEIS